MIAELRTFIAVVRHGSFAAAGERVGLTQSAVSSQIRRLEASLGFALFERTGRSARLNEAGARTLARAEDLIARFGRLGEAGDGDQAPAVLRIGAIATVQPTLLAAAMPGFRASQPGARVRLVPGVSLAMLDQIDGGQLDAAIVVRPPFGLPAGLDWQPLLREPYVLLVPGRQRPAGRKGRDPDWRTAIEQHPFIRYDRSSFGGRQVDRFLRQQGCRINEVAEVDEIAALFALVAQGVGAALAPLSAACLPIAAGARALSLGAAGFEREIGLILPNVPAGSRVLADLVRELRRVAAGLQRGTAGV